MASLSSGVHVACELDGPGLVSFVFYMQSLFSAFQQLGSIYTALAQAIGAADKARFRFPLAALLYDL